MNRRWESDPVFGCRVRGSARRVRKLRNLSVGLALCVVYDDGGIAFDRAGTAVQAEVASRITAQQERRIRVSLCGLDRDGAFTHCDEHAIPRALDAECGAVHGHARVAGLDRERLGLGVRNDGRREGAAFELQGQKFTRVGDERGRVRLQCPTRAARVLDGQALEIPGLAQ